MRVAIIGAGNQGLGLAALLAAEREVEAIVVLDSDGDRARRGSARVVERLGRSATATVVGERVDATDPGRVAGLLARADVAINATMPELNRPVMEACLDAGAHYVDLYAHPPGDEGTDGPETLAGQLALDDRFAAAGLVAIPSVGVNPGWVDIAISREAERLDEVDRVLVREVEWMDSDELLCSGPPRLLLEMFFADPAGLLDGYEEYDFPEPVGRQGVLAAGPGEKFAVLSAGLNMKDVLLSAVAGQIGRHRGAEDMLDLFARSFRPTSDLDFERATEAGTVRDAAWVSVVEVHGRSAGSTVVRKIACLATLEATRRRIPWAPPGVLATTALPAEVVLRLGRGDLAPPGVHRVATLPCAAELADSVESRGVTVTTGPRDA